MLTEAKIYKVIISAIFWVAKFIIQFHAIPPSYDSIAGSSAKVSHNHNFCPNWTYWNFGLYQF